MKIGVLSEGFAESVDGWKTHRIIPRPDGKVDQENSILNYDVFLVDFSQISFDDASSLNKVRHILQDRIRAGCAMLVFIGEEHVQRGPSTIQLFDCIPFFSSITRFHRFFKYPSKSVTCTFLPGTFASDLWIDLAKDFTSETYFQTVGAFSISDFTLRSLYKDSGHHDVGYEIRPDRSEGVVVLLPRPIDKRKVISAVLERVFPRYIPRFSTDQSQPESHPWIADERLLIPGIAELESKKIEVMAQIDTAKAVVSKINKDSAELSKWLGLLSAHHKKFETLTGEAFNFLLNLNGNWQHEPKADDGPDVVFTAGGIPFIVECIGTENVVPKSKGEQLAGWMSQEDYIEEANGILVANPLRTLPPKQRQEKFTEKAENLFSDHLLRAATKRQFAIVWSFQLYQLVMAKLSGQAINETALVSALKSPGLASLDTPGIVGS